MSMYDNTINLLRGQQRSRFPSVSYAKNRSAISPPKIEILRDVHAQMARSWLADHGILVGLRSQRASLSEVSPQTIPDMMGA